MTRPNTNTETCLLPTVRRLDGVVGARECTANETAGVGVVDEQNDTVRARDAQEGADDHEDHVEDPFGLLEQGAGLDVVPVVVEVEDGREDEGERAEADGTDEGDEVVEDGNG